MGFFDQLRGFFTRFTRPSYAWPAMDVHLSGHRVLHLVGSIHMGTQNMSPLPARLLAKLRQADALIVEADISTHSSPFSDITPEPALAERLSAADYQQVEALCQELEINLSSLDNLPLWQIALVLQAHQAQRLGLRASYGIDYQLLQAARELGKPVQELEGTQNQVELLTGLPQGGGILLKDTLNNWHTNARLLQIMIGWWLESTPRKQEIHLPETFSEEMYQVLINQRNRQWSTFLQGLPAGHYVVAVGAMHLFGEGNLPELLKNK